MEHFWSELGDKMKGAYEEAERRSKKDLSMLSNIPQILSFLKDMNQEDLLLLLDQARKIKKRKNPKNPPIDGDFYKCRDLLNAEDNKLIDRVREFMLKEIEPIA